MPKNYPMNTLTQGFESWLVQDFENGPGKSIWIRGQSYKSAGHASNLAMLNFINFKLPQVDSSTNKLLDAVDLHLLRNSILWTLSTGLEFDEEENGNRIEVTCTLKTNDKDFTKHVKTATLRKNVSEASKRNAIHEAKEKAKKKAEEAFFEYLFDGDEPTAFTVDQFGRPVEEN